ncbi:MAG: 3-hydroxyacyl-CoA dehydrogenase [Polyangiales bacterium]
MPNGSPNIVQQQPPPGTTATAGSSAPPSDAGAAMLAATLTEPMLFWLDIATNAVYRAKADGSDAHPIVTGNGISAPDGVNVDVEGGHLYWTNMGSALGGANLGTVQRAALDGTAVETIVPAGVGNTFKQMTIDRVHHKLYWCDREGAKVWRANLDGSQHEILASGHGFNQLVGIALDVPHAEFYFTDRNARKIMRAGFELPAGQTDANRTDIEDLLVLGSTAMPIDLDVDLDKRLLYYTDRALGTVSRMPMDLPAGQSASSRTDVETLVTGVSEPIGISLDLKASAMFFGDLSGQIWHADLDGKNRTSIAHSTSVTGVTLVYMPAQ